MASNAWKYHEKTVANHFGGTRPPRWNYGIPTPDIICSMEDFCGIPGTLLIECKYRANMPWHNRAVEALKEGDVVRCDNILLWNMVNSEAIMTVPEILVENYNEFPELPYKIPKYLEEWIAQSESYSEWVGRSPGIYLLCIAQKNSAKRIIITRDQNIKSMLDG